MRDEEIVVYVDFENFSEKCRSWGWGCEVESGSFVVFVFLKDRGDLNIFIGFRVY